MRHQSSCQGAVACLAILDRESGCGVLVMAQPCLKPLPLYRQRDPHASDLWRLIDEPFDVTLRYRLKRLPGRFAAMDPIFLGNPPALSADFLKDRPIAGLGGPEPAIKALLNKHVVDRRFRFRAVEPFLGHLKTTFHIPN